MIPPGRSHGPDQALPARGERGASLVEFALIVPLLFGVLFGIIDFGHNYSQVLDIRQGAREGARMVAVNYTGGGAATGTGQASVMIGEICNRIDGGAGTSVQLALDAGVTGSPAGSVGRSATVTITQPASSLSGFYAPLFRGRTLTSSIRTRLEVKSTWASASGACS